MSKLPISNLIKTFTIYKPMHTSKLPTSNFKGIYNLQEHLQRATKMKCNVRMQTSLENPATIKEKEKSEAIKKKVNQSKKHFKKLKKSKQQQNY